MKLTTGLEAKKQLVLSRFVALYLLALESKLQDHV